jgi:serine/threonine protein kinase/tetratricopeptide (TPR) repeat protein
MSQHESGTPDSINNHSTPPDHSRESESSSLPDGGAELRTVLAQVVNASRGEWLAVLRADQRKRWQSGQRVLAEAYLEQLPELRDDEEAVLDLIYSEVLLRKEQGETPRLEEYVRRFSHYQERLERQFELHQALAACTPTTAHTPPPGEAQSSTPPTRAPESDPRQSQSEGTIGSTGGSYKIVRLHARGGLGEVHVAQDEILHREVALKRIRQEYRDDSASRREFLREAEITARLEHPGIVPVHALMQDETGEPSYAMRFIQGESLDAAIKRFHEGDQNPKRDPGERSLALRELLNRYVAVCNTIAYAHSRGVLHRDLKPQNVMLGKYGETLVVDWGLAKSFERSEEARASGEETVRPAATQQECHETRPGDVKGTPAYMSPEQASGRTDEIGPASDIFALGATLYAILTGTAPYKGQDAVLKAQKAEFQLPRQVNSQVPRALQAICLRAMEAKLHQRYATPIHLADDIVKWLGGEPVSAYGEGLAERGRRWARRHKTLVAVGLAVLVVLITGFTIQEFRLQRQDQEHQRELLQAVAAIENRGVAELLAGNFAGAEQLLTEALAQPGDSPDIRIARERIVGNLDCARRLHEFEKQTRSAERLLTHDRYEIAAQEYEAAIFAITQQDENWPSRLRSIGFSQNRLDNITRDVQLHLLMLATIKARMGYFNKTDDQAAKREFESARLVCEQAQRLGVTLAATMLHSWCTAQLGKPSIIIDAPSEPTGAIDWYLLGILNYWLKAYPDDPISQIVKQYARQFVDPKDPWGKAELCLRYAATLDPDHYWTFHWLGVLLEAQGKFDQAELAYSVCIGLKPDYTDGYLMRSQAILDQMPIEANPDIRAKLVLRAMENYNKAIQLDPKDPYGFAGRGLAYLEIDLVPEYQNNAIVDLTRAIDLGSGALADDPNFFRAYSGRGEAFFNVGQYDRAIEDFTEAISKFPKLIQTSRWRKDELYSKRAVCRFYRGDFEGTLKDCGEALNINRFSGSSARTYFYRGMAFAELKNMRDAADAFGSAAAQSRNRQFRDLELKSLEKLAQASLTLKDTERCLRSCTDIVDLLDVGANPSALADFGIVCLILPPSQRVKGKFLDFARKLSDAKTPGSEQIRGAAYYRAGDYQQAYDLLLAAEGKTGTNRPAISRLFLAMAAHQLDRHDVARSWLEKAEHLFKEHSALRTVFWHERAEMDQLVGEARNLITH